MHTRPPLPIHGPLLHSVLPVLLALLLHADMAAADSSDLSLFGAGGGVPPNILLLLDSSGSMGKPPSGGVERKRDLANQAIADLVTAVNSPDGSGGYLNNARFGFSIFTKDGARLLVPIGEDNFEDILTWVLEPDVPTAADAINKIGGNSHGLAVMDSARYLAHTATFGPFPPFGFADAAYSGPAYTGTADPGAFPNEDPTLPSPWDLACRPTALILIDDGLWGGSDGARFGDCPDMDGDGSGGTCALEFIGDLSGDGEFWMEDVTKKMFEYDFAPGLTGFQNVTTHVISFDEPLSIELMKIAAALGGGSFYFADSGASLGGALLSITLNIFEGTASFTSFAVPSSRTEAGGFGYNAFFEPDGAKAVWAGHLEAYRLAPDGSLLDRDGNSALDADGKLIEPHLPYWDAGAVLASDTSRNLFTTQAGNQISFDTSTVTVEDLELESVGVPIPPPDACSLVAENLPPGYYLGFPAITAPYKAAPGSKVKVRYCMHSSRHGKKKDYLGTYPIDAAGTDAIAVKERKDKDATACVFGADGKPTSGFKDHDLLVGTEEGSIHVRIYLADDFSPAGLAAWSPSICVKAGGAGKPPISPDFAPYPNSSTSGIDTYEELRVAVIDFAHGKDAFDQDGDGDATNLRSVVLGDIFHSSPLIVAGVPWSRLGSEPGFSAFRTAYETRDRVVYAGANDGMLHAFDGGSHQIGDDPDTTFVESEYYTPGTGEELFGYIPGLLLPQIKILSHNRPRSTYYVDGSPVAADAWIGDDPSSKTSDEWATVLVTGLREGGPGYLALAISDPTAVAGPHGPYPTLLWEFPNPKLGEAWSEPVITRVKLDASSGFGDHCGTMPGDGDCRERWVAIFGGGYEQGADPNSLAYEGDPAAALWTDRSRSIFIVALDNGELLASVEFDATGAQGPADMKYALPASPAAVDLDFDGTTDVIYIGDLGGQMWKWDLSAKGVDSTGDSRIDNWTAGVFFRNDPVKLSSGKLRYRSFFFAPEAAFQKGHLTLAFGSGEREDLSYGGETGLDDNNRFYVMQDFAPTGASAISSTTTEANLTNVTGSDTDTDLTDSGFFFVVADGEKFVTDSTIFAGHVIVASYTPESGADLCKTAGGQAYLYMVDLGTGQGFLGDGEGGDPPAEDRRVLIGGGLPTSPRVTVAPNPSDDTISIKTSSGVVRILDAPPRPPDGASLIYWRQVF